MLIIFYQRYTQIINNKLIIVIVSLVDKKPFFALDVWSFTYKPSCAMTSTSYSPVGGESKLTSRGLNN
jgi:hypothetical protein